MCANTCWRAVMYFNVFTDILALIWSVLYYDFYYFSFVNFKLLFFKDKSRLLTYLLLVIRTMKVKFAYTEEMKNQHLILY